MSASSPVASLADENLSPAEQQMLTAAIIGALIDLQTGDASDDPAQGERWDTSRQIRATLLAELLTGKRHGDKTARAVKLRGARITGPLDLEASTISCPLLLQDCYLDERVNLDEATAPSIRMPGCHLPTLTAAQLRTTGDLQLNATKFFANGEVNLLGGHIGGQLILSGASLTNTSGPALTADGLTVDQGMFCDDGFTAKGDVRLADAHIGGQLILNGATLTNPDGTALFADGLTVDRDMFCGDGFTATGEIRLNGAHIGGQLNLNGANLARPGGTALCGQMLTVDHAMVGNEGFTAIGEVSLSGAHIGGLNLNGANLANPGGTALNVDGLIATHGMSCKEGFTATGMTSLLGAHIGGQLILDGATLTNPDGTALFADGLTVDRDMFCGDGFTATGEIRLNGAHIGGQFILTPAKLTNPGGTALSANDVTVDRDMFCGIGFIATGEICLVGATIRGALNMAGATLTNPAGSILDFEAANINTLLMPRTQPYGEVILTNAKVEVFDDHEVGWPAVLRLRGFVYDSLKNQDVSTRARLQWLKRDPGNFTPQLYDQLAAVYRRAGDEPAARKVAIAKQWRRRRVLNPLNWLWYATVGYGYRTWLAAIWLAALVALGTWVFSRAYPARMIAISSHPPAFHAAAYALDLLLPVIGLGQKGAWQPQGSALYWSWVLTGAGWVLTTAVVAGLTGILKRD